MHKTALSFDEVSSACQRLKDRGQTPSLRAVRTEIGRGSLTTIHGFMSTWHEHQRASPEPSNPAIRALETLAPSAAAHLREAYRSALTKEMDDLKGQLDQQNRSMVELREAIGSLENERESLEERLKVSQSRALSLEDLKDRISSLSPVFAGQLEAHTAHLSTSIQDHGTQVAHQQSAAQAKHLTMHQELRQDQAAIQVQLTHQQRLLEALQADQLASKAIATATIQLVQTMADQLTAHTAALATVMERQARSEGQVRQRLAHLQSHLGKARRRPQAGELPPIRSR